MGVLYCGHSFLWASYPGEALNQPILNCRWMPVAISSIHYIRHKVGKRRIPGDETSGLRFLGRLFMESCMPRKRFKKVPYPC